MLGVIIETGLTEQHKQHPLLVHRLAKRLVTLVQPLVLQDGILVEYSSISVLVLQYGTSICLYSSGICSNIEFVSSPAKKNTCPTKSRKVLQNLKNSSDELK